MKAKTKSTARRLGGIAVAVALTMSLGATSLVASAENWVTDFDSREEAWNAAEELNKEIAGEGMVLLKNDGTLPVEKGARVSVLGVAQDNIVETSGSVTESLKNAGYKVNPTLENFYANDSSAYMSEAELTAAAENSMDLYSDVAVIVIGRGAAGEARDRQVDTRLNINAETLSLEGEVDNETYLGKETGWEHENHGTDKEGNAYKHELQLMNCEEELIKLAKEKCDKIVVLYSSANQFEMGNLQDDEDINAILWIGRPGDGGMDAIGEVLNGTINPSGKLVDEWTRDLTNDPTYANFRVAFYSNDIYDTESEKVNGTYTAANLFGDLPSTFKYYEYEESIYLGYKYYETYWYEATQNNESPKVNGTTVSADEWYAHNVVYPFGYGLSYTDFSFELEGITDNNGQALGATVAAADLSSSAGSPAKIETLTAKVAVTNTGDVAGKEVVQAYVTMPYTAGETEKAYLNLVGFAKTDTLAPGETQVVEVTFNVQDFASYDAENKDNDADGHKGYELDAGEYTIHFMNSSSHTNFGTEAYASKVFTLDEDANLDADDFSGNAIENRFSEENDDYYGKLLSDESSDPMVELSRSDFDGTQPTSPEYADIENGLTSKTALSQKAIDTINKYRFIDADDFGKTFNGTEYYDDGDYQTAYDELTEEEKTSLFGENGTWTQGAGVIGEDGMYETVLADMAGKALDSADWDTFLNQLTWEEFAIILNYGYHGTLAIDTIGKLETSDENGPNHMFNNFFWAFEPMIASTWNVELAERQGMMAGNMLLMLDCTGWYGPGMNIHRSAFSGRSAEYYSQDTMLSGYIGAAVVKGAQSRGVSVYVKHIGLYDQAPNSATWHGVNASEQVIRETYMPTFRMAMQEGGAAAAMNEYGRVGAVYAGTNSALLTGLVRDEWGWNGFVVTDMIRNQETADGLIRAGGVLIDGDFAGGTHGSITYTWGDDRNGNKGLSGEWDEEAGCVTVNGKRNDEQWYCARLAVKRYLYQLANSAGTYNGITDRALEETIDATQGTALAETRILADSYYTDHDITTEITEGALPQGMTLTDGVLSGTPVESGTFNVTVSVTADGWIGMTVDLTINVKSVMSISSDISTIETGESVNAYVLLPETITEFSMEIVEGTLPEGLSFASDGRITGTATTAGTYSFTVQATAGESVYLFDYTITVTGEDYVVNNVTKVELVEGDIVVTYTDGTTTTIDLPEAEQAGKTVENVTINEAGDTITVTYTDGTTSTLAISAPAAEESGCGSAVNGLIGFALAVPVIAAAAIVVNRKRINK